MSVQIVNFSTGQALDTRQAVEGDLAILWAVPPLNLTGVKVYFDDLAQPPILWPSNTPYILLPAGTRRVWFSGAVTTGGSLLIGPCGFQPAPNSLLVPAPVLLDVEAGGAVVHEAFATAAVLICGDTGTGGYRRLWLANPAGGNGGGLPGLALLAASNLQSATGGVVALSQCALQTTQQQGPLGALATGRISTVQSGNLQNVLAGANSAIYNPYGAGSAFDFDWQGVMLAVYLSTANFVLTWNLKAQGFHGLVNPSAGLAGLNVFASAAAGAALPVGLYVFTWTKRGIVCHAPATPPAVLTPPPCQESIQIGITNLDGAAAHTFDYQFCVNS